MFYANLCNTSMLGGGVSNTIDEALKYLKTRYENVPE
jgi:hypothetical protein